MKSQFNEILIEDLHRSINSVRPFYISVSTSASGANYAADQPKCIGKITYSCYLENYSRKWRRSRRRKGNGGQRMTRCAGYGDTEGERSGGIEVHANEVEFSFAERLNR